MFSLGLHADSFSTTAYSFSQSQPVVRYCEYSSLTYVQVNVMHGLMHVYCYFVAAFDLFSRLCFCLSASHSFEGFKQTEMAL